MNQILRQIFVTLCIASLLLNPQAMAVTECDSAVLNQTQIRALIKKERDEFSERMNTFTSRAYFSYFANKVDAEILQTCKQKNLCSNQEIYTLTKSVLQKIFVKAGALDANVRIVQSSIIYIALMASVWGAGEWASKQIKAEDSFLKDHPGLTVVLTFIIGGLWVKFGNPMMRMHDADLDMILQRIKTGKNTKAPMTDESKRMLRDTVDRMSAGLNDLERTSTIQVYFFGSGIRGTFKTLKPLSDTAALLEKELETVAMKLKQAAKISAETANELKKQQNVLIEKIAASDEESAKILAELCYDYRNVYSFVQADTENLAFFIRLNYAPAERSIAIRERIRDRTLAQLTQYDKDLQNHPEYADFYMNALNSWLEIP